MALFRILVVRLGAMGDIIHSLPAVASLKQSFPQSHLTWVVKPHWIPLLENNPFIDEIIPFERTFSGIRHAWRQIRSQRYDVAIDLQGLIQSALIAKASRSTNIMGLNRSQAREPFAARFYTTPVHSTAIHRVDRYRELVTAAGATPSAPIFPLPVGSPGGDLPNEPFVLACPLAGWASKQWPLTSYSALAKQLRDQLNMALVVNGPPQSLAALQSIAGAHIHLSGISGLIHATRRAQAIIGVDSGPLHLAAALNKPGVAIYGPTDPASHGPYGTTIKVLRSTTAVTSYKRSTTIDPSMLTISADQVMHSLEESLRTKATGIAQ